MLSEKAKVAAFFKKYGMHPDEINLEADYKNFILEMEKGLNNFNETLKMIPTYLTIKTDFQKNESIIAIDAGGTNLRTAVVSFNNNNVPEISHFENHSMPGANNEITKDEFFDKIAEYLLPIINLSNKIAFCFSYPVNMEINGDGRLIRFTKEIKIKGMENELICEGVKNSLLKFGVKEEKKFILLNDTVSTMLAGTIFGKQKYSSYIGLILATGVNTCYAEDIKNIKKIKTNSDGSMIINMESGGYNSISMGKFDKILDSNTENFNQQFYEKMVSGAYLGKLTGYVINGAVEENLFSEYFQNNFIKIDINSISIKEISEFCKQPFSSERLSLCCENDIDRAILYHIIDLMFERAAKLVTLCLSSILIKINKGTNPVLPVCISADGSVFNKCTLLRNKIDYYMKQFTNDRNNLYFEFVTPENATLIGTAIAGLYNL